MKKFNTSYLPYIGAFAQAVLFSFAGVKAFGVWGWAIGPGVGITASLSVAVAASGIGSITAKGRKQLATAGLILMGIFSASTVSLSIAAPESVWTAISWGCAVDVSIVLAGAISGKGLVAQDETKGNVSGTTETKPKRGKKTETQVAQPETAVTQPVATVSTVSKKPITDAELVSFFTSNPNATNAEAARHFKVSHTAIGKRSKKLFAVKHEMQTEQVKPL